MFITFLRSPGLLRAAVHGPVQSGLPLQSKGHRHNLPTLLESKEQSCQEHPGTQLVVTSATLVVTGALLVVTKSERMGFTGVHLPKNEEPNQSCQGFLKLPKSPEAHKNGLIRGMDDDPSSTRDAEYPASRSCPSLGVKDIRVQSFCCMLRKRSVVFVR